MTVQTSSNVATGIGNGVTTVFPVGYKFNEESDLVVLRIDDATSAAETLTLNSDYTVQGAGNEAGGSVTMAAPLAVGKTLTITRIVDILQLTDLRNQGKFFAEVHEDSFDKFIMIMQQLFQAVGDSLQLNAARNRWDAKGRRIINVGDPVDAQDAVTKSWLEAYISALLQTSIGPVQTAASVLYVAPSGRIITLQDKLDDYISVKDFGAVGDGVADDTSAIHAAFDYAKSKRGEVFFPPGTYRVTSGYTQSLSRKDIRIFGSGSTRELFAGDTDKGSLILLDSTDPASFFYKSTANHNLQVDDITFSCAQFVQDRAFFHLGANTSQFFTRVNFESVERPIVWPAGTYFQSSAYRDVQFRNSGTFHSETDILICTLLVLDNVNHEGSVPANAEQVVCNLSGVRQIQGTNFLLEGVSPGAGWTILKLGATGFDPDWVAAPLANFDGFWIEFSGAPFANCVEQKRGLVRIQNTNSFITPTNQYALTEKAVVELDATSFTGTSFDPATAFSMDSSYCTVIINGAGVINTRQLIQQRIVYNDCFVASSDNNVSMARFSTTAPELLYAYDGKPFDAALVDAGAFGGTAFRQETDATYGRKLSLYPSANSIDARVRVKSFDSFKAGDQFFIKVRAKLPVFTGNQIQFVASVGGTGTIGAYPFFAANYSGQVVTLTVPFRLQADALSVGVGIATVDVTSLTDPIEIYHLEIYRGGTVTNSYRTAYPSKLEFYATAVPTTGTWAQGDRAINSAPAVGQPKSWVCTVAGTPGTWVSEGNL